jgi:choice-of-anchor C domain-containing protein
MEKTMKLLKHSLLIVAVASLAYHSIVGASNLPTQTPAASPAKSGAASHRSSGAAAAGAQSQRRNVTGLWAFTLKTGFGVKQGYVKLTQSGDELTGVYRTTVGEKGEQETEVEGRVLGDNVFFTRKTAFQGQTYTMVLSDDGNSMDGYGDGWFLNHSSTNMVRMDKNGNRITAKISPKIKPAGAAAAPMGPSIVVNGSFEEGAVCQGDHKQINLGGGDVYGWRVTSGSVDISQNPAWNTPFGQRCIDLNGANTGVMAQTLTTEPGATYQVRFWLSGNPGMGPDRKTMYVRAAGQSQSYDFDTRGHSMHDMGWVEKSWQFPATAKYTVLEFGSTVPNSLAGPMIDNVSVVKIKGGTPAKLGDDTASGAPPSAASTPPAVANTPAVAAGTPQAVATTSPSPAATSSSATATPATATPTTATPTTATPATATPAGTAASTTPVATVPTASVPATPAIQSISPRWKSICEQLEKLVKQYYPKANFSSSDKDLHFDFKIKSVSGYYGDIMVPQEGGVICDLKVQSGATQPGPVETKETKDSAQSTISVASDLYSQQCLSRLTSQLTFYKDAPADFKTKFLQILIQFKDGP